MPSVVQPWVSEISLMQQTVLLTAIRGPDGLPKYGPTKMILRWYRRCVLYSAMDHRIFTDPISTGGGSFTGPSVGGTLMLLEEEIEYTKPDGTKNKFLTPNWYAGMNPILDRYLMDLDSIPHHFQLHLMHAAEILGYKHPIINIRYWWLCFYVRLAKDMHLYPEPEHDLDRRLSDNRDNWLEYADKATID